MVEPLENVERETVRIPANIMGLLRQSYDSREKVLDWLMALAVAGLMVYIFRDQIATFALGTGAGPNAGMTAPPKPNQDVSGAFPDQPATARIYTYNMPTSRNIRFGIGPSSTRPPANPSRSPEYTE